MSPLNHPTILGDIIYARRASREYFCPRVARKKSRHSRKVINPYILVLRKVDRTIEMYVVIEARGEERRSAEKRERGGGK